MTDQVVIFDTEYTAWDGSRDRSWGDPDEHRELVQIGAVQVDTESLAEAGTFECLVKPVLNPVLSDFLCGLTGISNEAVAARGLDFETAYGDFLKFLGDRPLFCYGRDHLVVAENLDLYRLRDRLSGVTATNLQPWFAAQGIDVRRVNSGRLAQTAGTKVDAPGAEHDALFDCRSILAAIRVFTEQGAPSPF